MSDPIRQQIKEHALKIAEETACMRIYKYRLDSDDGWFFFIARDIGKARRMYPDKKVLAASQGDAYGIAVRALR